jgi:hypothetical protein
MTFKLKPLKDLLAMSKDKLHEAMAPVRARKIKAQAELELAKLDTELIELESGVQESFTGEAIEFPKLLDKLDRIALLERRKKQYDKVLAELFPA